MTVHDKPRWFDYPFIAVGAVIYSALGLVARIRHRKETHR